MTFTKKKAEKSCVMDKRGVSGSKLASELSDEENKKLLIQNILKEIYGIEHYRCLKKQEPYFYNAISEAIKLSFKEGKEIAISKFKEKLKEIRFDLEVIALKSYPENTEEDIEELDDRIKSAISKIDNVLNKTAQEILG